MEVILLEKMKKLGDIGQTVRVKPGYARNYLFPNKMAIRATKENIEFFDKQKEQLNKANSEKIKIAKEMLLKVSNDVKIYREASEQGALFGSVTARDVINELNTVDDLSLKAKDLIIKHVIKNVGEFTGTLILHPEVSKEIKISVVSTEK
ncbi:MAG: 50S ribosomal protein L9 [Pseudomonadota bacterium]|nr:50S ribosomal protein L9 [Pseudomonadota bacterium]